MRFMTDRLWSEYEQWLLRRVGLSDNGYSRLFEQLQNTLFEIVLPGDRNRAMDGIVLRENFYDDWGVEDAVFDHRDDCHVLEMLCALAIRIEDDYVGDPSDPHPEWIFWEMLDNLGLTRYDDRDYDEELVHDILERWMERGFSYNGNGSLFPLDCPRRDQRRIEIWSQMNEYLSEKGY